MASLELYRALIPDHTAGVLDGTVLTWLGLAIRRHDAGSFGSVYPEAMVFWAAHRIQTLPGSGAPGAPPAGAAGPLVSHRDGDLSRTYAPPSSGVVASGSDADFQRTTYGQDYLDLRDSRAATGPDLIMPESL